jgi:hypothetical protein
LVPATGRAAAAPLLFAGGNRSIAFFDPIFWLCHVSILNAILLKSKLRLAVSFLLLLDFHFDSTPKEFESFLLILVKENFFELQLFFFG